MISGLELPAPLVDPFKHRLLTGWQITDCGSIDFTQLPYAPQLGRHFYRGEIYEDALKLYNVTESLATFNPDLYRQYSRLHPSM